MPSNVAARMTLAADPGSLHSAVAAGILGAGPVILGAAEDCALAARAAQAQVNVGAMPTEAARQVAQEIQAGGRQDAGLRAPRSIGRVDPRAERILELARRSAV